MSQTRRSKHHSIFERIERKVDTLLQLMKKYHADPLLTPQLSRSTGTATPQEEPTLRPTTRKSRETVYPDGLQKFNEFVKSMHENLKQDNPTATYQEALQKAAPLWREKTKNSKTVTRKVNKTPGRFSPQRSLASRSMTSKVELTPNSTPYFTPENELASESELARENEVAPENEVTPENEVAPENEVTPENEVAPENEYSDEEEEESQFLTQNRSQIPTLIPSISKRENTPYPK
jgi:hypothetical protein